MAVRAVVDTNVIVRGLINPNAFAGRVLQEIQAGRITLVTSPALLRELGDVVWRDHIRERIPLSDEQLNRLLDHLQSVFERVPGAIEVYAVADDPKDNPVLACSVEARAEVVVTEDRGHLLPLGQYRLADFTVNIMTCSDFLSWLERSAVTDDG